MSSFSFLALLLPSLAQAGTQARLERAPGKVELGQAIAVDLLAGRDATPLVWGTTSADGSGDPCMVELTSQSAVSGIAKGTAEAMKLKVKTRKLNGADVELTKLPNLKIGDLVIEDLVVQVNEKVSSGACVQLSLPSTGLAWAVTPSSGKAHFAPASQAEALLGQVGGSRLSFQGRERFKAKYGKDKLEIGAWPVVVQGNVGGQALDLNLGFGGRNEVSHKVALGGPEAADGDTRANWAEVQVGGLSLGSAWMQRNSAYRVLDPKGDAPLAYGRVGTALLGGFDIAVDPAGSLALKEAATQLRQDPRQANLERAEAALAKCLDPEKAPEGDEAKKTPEERCGGAYSKLAGAQLALGKLDEALTSRQVAVTNDARSCEAWSGIGEVRLAMGDAAEAAKAFEAASTRYHAWWDQDPWARQKAQKAFDKLDDAEKKQAENPPQPASCASADGRLAIALLAANRTDELAALAKARTDLDPVLPSVLGSQLILEDKVEAAHGPWRMVEHLTVGPSVAAKAGLARLFANQRDWDSAMVNIEAALAMAPEDASVLGLWVQLLVESKGADEALKAARERVAQRPGSPAAWLAVALAARAQGSAPDFAIRDADPLFAARLGRATMDADLNAMWARFLVATGRLEAAGSAVERALQIDPRSPQAWLARAELQRALGQDAREALLRAVQGGNGHPAYTLLIGQAR